MNHSSRRLACLFLLIAFLAGSTAQAAVVTYVATLSGAAEATPNASPGVGMATVEIDAAAHTMRVLIEFSGLSIGNTACHIHGPTASAGTGTAGVATTTPTFTDFPTGATSGSYDHTFDMTMSSSYNASFVTAQGSIAAAEAALFAAIADGKAYVNIHSSNYPAGEIRGFLTLQVVGTEPSSWGVVKTLYH